MNNPKNSKSRGVPAEVLQSFKCLEEFDCYAQSIASDLDNARSQVEANLRPNTGSMHSTPQGRGAPSHEGFSLHDDTYWENGTFLHNFQGGDDDSSSSRPKPFDIPPQFSSRANGYPNQRRGEPSFGAGTRYKDTNPSNFDVPDSGADVMQQPAGRGRGGSQARGRGAGSGYFNDRNRNQHSGNVGQKTIHFSNDTNFNSARQGNPSDNAGERAGSLENQMYNFFSTPIAFRKRTSGLPAHSSTRVEPPNGNPTDTFSLQNNTFNIHSQSVGNGRNQDSFNPNNPPSNRQGHQQSQSNPRGNYGQQSYNPHSGANHFQQSSNPHPGANNVHHNATNYGDSGNFSCNSTHGPLVRGPEPKVPKFSGFRHEYAEWKLSFRMVMDHFADNVRIPVLKDHLDGASVAMISFISVADHDAYSQIWVELDKWHSSGGSEPQYHTGQLLKLIRRKKCSTVEDLVHVHNELRFHWAKLCRIGPKYAGYGESILVGISDLLFGQSQNEVDRLAFENRNFNVPSVLNAIWCHIGQARSRQYRLSSDSHSFPQQPTFRNNTVTFSDKPPSPKPDLTGSHKSRRDNSPYPTGVPRTPPASPSRRGETSRSPSPKPGKCYKCAFCSVDDHKSIECAKWTSAQFYEAAFRNYLCFICLTPNHRARVCPYPMWCQGAACQAIPRHAPCLCKALLAKAGTT